MTAKRDHQAATDQHGRLSQIVMTAPPQTQHGCHRNRESRSLPEEAVADVKSVVAPDDGENGRRGDDPGQVFPGPPNPVGHTLLGGDDLLANVH